MYAEGDYVGIDEDARAYDAPHHDHGGVENSEQLLWLDGIHKRWLSYSMVNPAEKAVVGRLNRDHLNTMLWSGRVESARQVRPMR